jgi:ABC-type spermidine/putrescine transport system permease subunit II
MPSISYLPEVPKRRVVSKHDNNVNTVESIYNTMWLLGVISICISIVCGCMGGYALSSETRVSLFFDVCNFFLLVIDTIFDIIIIIANMGLYYCASDTNAILINRTRLNYILKSH